MAEGGREPRPPCLPPKTAAFNLGALDLGGGSSSTSTMYSFTQDSSMLRPPPLPPRRSVFSDKCNGSGDLTSIPPAPTSAATWTSSDLLKLLRAPSGSDSRTSIKSIDALFLEDHSWKQQSSSVTTTRTEHFQQRQQTWVSTHQQNHVFVGTEMTHSNSAPNFNALSSSAGVSPVHVHNLNSALPSKLDIEKTMFSVLRKRPDSNLIDLSGDAELARKRESLRKSGDSLDDLLDLFDPLREFELTVEVEEKTHTSQSAAEAYRSEQTECKASAAPSRPPRHSPVSAQKRAQDSPPQEAAHSVEALRMQRHIHRMELLGSLTVERREVTHGDDIEAFWAKVKQLRSEFTYDDHHTNAGLVISPTLENKWEKHLSIKLEVTTSIADRPFCFTCDVGTSIEHIISNTICSLRDDLSDIALENYVLKVKGLAEYLTPDSVLKEYEYVHQCYKFMKPVCLTLIDVRDLKKPWMRTLRDDSEFLEVKTKALLSQPPGRVSFDSVSILMETFRKEAKKVQSSACSGCLQPNGAIQAVKAICATLSQIEILEIIHAIEGLKHICSQVPEADGSNDDFAASQEAGRGSVVTRERVAEVVFYSLLQLQSALRTLVTIYCRSFRVDFCLPPGEDGPVKKQQRPVTTFHDTFLFNAGSVHQLRPQWVAEYDQFLLSCELRYGSRVMSVGETKKVKASRNLFELIVFDEWLEMKVFMRNLPREATLYMALYGIKPSQENKSAEPQALDRVLLAWTSQALFSSRLELIQGSLFLGFWSSEVDEQSGPAQSNDAFSCPILRVQFPEFESDVIFPQVARDDIVTCRASTYPLDSVMIQEISDILEKDPLSVPTTEDRKFFWDHRHYTLEIPHLLPKVLLSAHSWSWPFLPDIYFLLTEWRPASPINALTLLLPLFPDTQVRQTAVKWIKNIGSDELCDHLPQLIQALRFETWEDAPITWFLLERSLTSVRVAHQMFWLLKQNMENPLTLKRMKLIVQTLLVIVGKSFREIIEKQEEHLNQLCIIAEGVKETRESLRLDKLLQEMETIHNMMEESPSCLPLNPAMEVCGVDVKSCSYFTSNTLPLKVVYRSTEPGAKPIEVIYKVGDDLRQDMLTLQMIRIMDKFWLKEGLDLKIITFTCVATGNRKGMVEMVTEAETLRRIQTEHGLTGSFKDRPIAEWLQRHNTSELEYQQAVENFTYSCAGYCVATYILGICDRHNDNIMLKTSGHMFHIDFGKFLGDSQMFVNFKRDRAPFVLTSDMVYVINGGEKPSKKFQVFIDLCCQAFNIVRRNSNIFMTLFELMVTSGVPGVSTDAVNFVQKSLLLGSSEGEATAHFTRLIEESLRSRFTQLNFFIHNIAQLRFTGDHNDGLLLSFVPRTFTKESDGRIVSLTVTGCHKRYEPEKHYTYSVKITRESQTSSIHVFRTYAEFLELYQKLVRMFPLAKFYPLSKGSFVGRSNTREVAERRKQDVEAFLLSLKKMAEEVSHCSLIYTFFHPLLRDQEGMAEDETLTDNLCQFSKRVNLSQGIVGRIKLSIVYKAGSLSVMVMHAENLSCERKSSPDPYVKTYLLPDWDKSTKKKTKVVFKNSHPSFMELLVYNFPLAVVRSRMLEVSAWDHDRVQENEFLGAAIIELSRMDLSTETTHWYHLNNVRYRWQ
ncbi:phosphatidylinositol 4-phosphate 3-kinase C2 domain-containing subunit alpha [Ixodes scapularis]|uniref:phosphatidylinositol 4-phosphate 3-kinase C2 domain-containing subunit alpha n=1 Tax=Ixodes scapularis TaxID=6945 RepID=UPI001A9CD585|nr:phosphatidylinositol 4-phosphate 3-kinase C2 domain-containing subunit alpha [Ixodes scapularis]XP_029840716.2 phosphatidylinositol 4-phosphate 3-kinase C2 domain-containing subunit alpha [Ixodes scapularis]XP_029840717.2 phosphatidylinositol 4-phosphate 3-kinase C2 domain-containing subunit alpha [Ixodes scapularis]